MDRNREVRRGSMAASNGLARRRQRSSSLRDSPEDDVAMEMQETTRLRDRKKDRDRLSRSKRRRADRLMHGSNREDGGEDSTEESLDDDEEDEDEEAGPIRMPPPNLASSSLSNNHHRKSFPPAKVVRAAPWKVSDEMGFSVPKKARSASAKRSHEWLISGGGGGVSGGGGGGGGGEQLHRQASTSPARPPSVTISLPAPTSPSSSSVSLKKKLKPMGQKHRPPKISNKPASNQDEIEIEVAEVLYGLMRQSQCPSSATNSSQKLDSKEMNGSTTDARSRVSSPISASPSYPPQQQLKLPQNPSSSSTASVSAIAPKRKRPRVVKYEEESSSIFAVRNCSTASAGKIENEPSGKVGASSPKLEKNSGSPVDNNGGIALNSGSSQAPAPAPAPAPAVLSESPPPESAKPESNTILDSKPVTEQSEIRDGVQSKEVVVIPSSQKESPSVKMDIEPEDTTTTKAISTASGVQNHREENFKIDLMAPPSKSSPERDNAFDFGSDLKPNASTDVEMTQKVETEVKAEEKVDKLSNHDTREVGLLEKKTEGVVDECESQKSIASKQMGLDLQLDLQMPNKDSDPNPTSSNKPQIQNQQHHHHQQQPPLVPRNEPKLEKEAQSATMPLPMTAAGWPGGLPPMGCGTGQVRPLQGVVSLDGNPGSSNAMQPPHFILSQPRPKRCTYHYDIARNIYYHQQYARMNPYIAAAGGSASIYGTKPYNLNVLPPAETAIMGNPLQGSFPGRNSTQEKSQVEVVKDKSSVASNFMDPAPKKQIVLQQAPPQMHAPAFIFHLNQQQAAAVASNKSGAVKSQATGNPSSATSAQSAPGNSSSTAGTAPTLSFNYQNLAGSEGQQYLAILQNNGYPYPVPAQVGSLPHYRSGAPSQAMPFFNGSFYSSQMLHPSQLQQQQQLQSQSQQQPGQQSHQNTSTSSGSSSSQKHQHTQQNQQQRLPGDGSNVCGGNSNSFPASKNRSQQHQQNQSVPVIHQGRQLDTDMVVEDCSEGSRVSQGHKTVYGHNYGMQIHPKNFASMSSAALAGGSSGNHGGDKQQAQQQNSKGGELVPAQAFAMPFASFNGGTAVPGFDMSQNHLIFQSLPEAARHGYPQMAAAMAAAQAAQQKRTNPFSEESKTVGDSNIADDDRKAMTGKGPSSVGQALVFSRPDTNGPSTILGSSVVDSSARNLNLISAPSNVNRTSRSSNPTTGPMAGASTASNASNPQLQQQHQQLIQLQKQHQQQQMQQQQQQMQQQLHQQQQQLQHQHQQQLLQQQQLHHQQQQQMQQQQQQQLQHQLAAAAVTRSKPSNTTNASVYSDRLSSSPMAGKFPNALSVFPQALIQGGSPTQSPQWKNSTRTTASSVSSASSLVSNPSSLKNHHPQQQQQGRTQQGHTQISFGANNPSKPGTVAHGQQIPTNNQSPSSPVVVGSPPRSISKSAGGSPRTTSTGSKVGPTPSLSSQQHAKNSSSGPSRKSSPVGGRNVPSILGNSHVTSSPSSNAKAQSQHQQQQKQTLQQQTQIFFTGAYGQAQSPQSTTSTTANTSTSAIGYYHQRRQEQQQQQQQHGSSNTSSSGMLSLCSPLTLAGVTTSDPTKAAAAAVANNMKGGVPSPAVFHASQLATQSGVHPFMAAFPYIHVPTVQPKPAEQKQPTGNDNLHACWQPEKR